MMHCGASLLNKGIHYDIHLKMPLNVPVNCRLLQVSLLLIDGAGHRSVLSMYQRFPQGKNPEINYIFKLKLSVLEFSLFVSSFPERSLFNVSHF